MHDGMLGRRDAVHRPLRVAQCFRPVRRMRRGVRGRTGLHRRHLHLDVPGEPNHDRRRVLLVHDRPQQLRRVQHGYGIDGLPDGNPVHERNLSMHGIRTDAVRGCVCQYDDELDAERRELWGLREELHRWRDLPGWGVQVSRRPDAMQRNLHGRDE